MRETDSEGMQRALSLAREAAAAGEVPVGAVVLDASGRIIGEGRNIREETHDPTGHAEIVALRQAASSIGSWNLEGHTLVVTLEPCVMCAGAILQSRTGRVVFGAWDDKAGAAGSMYDVLRDRRLPYRAEVIGGMAEDAATALLHDFFDQRRGYSGRGAGMLDVQAHALGRETRDEVLQRGAVGECID